MRVRGSGVRGMSHSSIQPIPAPRPMTDSRVCPFCLRSVYSLREGKGHRYPCPCIDIERVSDRWNQYAVEAREDAEQDREAADTPSVQGGDAAPGSHANGVSGTRAHPPELHWQDIDNPFWVEEF